MGFFDTQNPGIGGLDELTTQEEVVVQSIAALGDPNADRILFWDDSAGSYAWLTPGTNLSITGTTLNATGGGGGGTPGGSDTQVQFNDAGSFGGDASLSYDKTTGTLSVGTKIKSPWYSDSSGVWGVFLEDASGVVIKPDVSKLVSIEDANTGARAVLDTTSALTTSRNYIFPDKDGTFAMLSDIVPAGADTQIQYNNSGAFGASSALAYDNANQHVLIGDGSMGPEIIFNQGSVPSSAFTNTIRVANQTIVDTGGGTIQMVAGSATNGNGDGGGFILQSGSGSGTGIGGSYELTAGNGGSTGNGGDLNIGAGSGGSTSGNGGNIVLFPGPVVSGTLGRLRLYHPAGSYFYYDFDTSNITANRTITFQDSDGTVAYLSDITGGSGITWTEVTGTSQTASADNGYITNNAGLVTVTLPTTCAVGKIIRVTGKGAGGWKIAQNASQKIIWNEGGVAGTNETTSGTSGHLDSTDDYDSIEIICITADTVWGVLSSKGNISIT